MEEKKILKSNARENKFCLRFEGRIEVALPPFKAVFDSNNRTKKDANGSFVCCAAATL